MELPPLNLSPQRVEGGEGIHEVGASVRRGANQDRSEFVQDGFHGAIHGAVDLDEEPVALPGQPTDCLFSLSHRRGSAVCQLTAPQLGIRSYIAMPHRLESACRITGRERAGQGWDIIRLVKPDQIIERDGPGSPGGDEDPGPVT